MKQEFTVRRHSKELFLFFAGWGMDATPFSRLDPYGTDVCICYDYRSDKWDTHLFSTYTSIRIAAWSMGVRMASKILKNTELPVTRKLAVNGTLYPADENRGIPPSLLKATIDHLSAESLKKFYRRMCGPRLNEFMAVRPRRSIEELKEELICIAAEADTGTTPGDSWDTVVIGRNDRIFPAASQLNAWEGHAGIQITDDFHYPDFNLLFHENHR